MIKMLFFKLYKFKNPLFLREVSKPIGIQSLNDALVIQDSTKENISLDLLKIDDDDINFLKFIKGINEINWKFYKRYVLSLCT